MYLLTVLSGSEYLQYNSQRHEDFESELAEGKREGERGRQPGENGREGERRKNGNITCE